MAASTIHRRLLNNDLARLSLAAQIRMMPDRLYRRAKNPLAAELGEEMVALDEVSGRTFGLNKTATWLWRLLEQPQTISALKRGMLDEFADVDEATCEAEVRSMVHELEAMGWIEPVRPNRVRN